MNKQQVATALEWGATWVFAVVGISMVIAGFIVTNLFALVYLATGFELLFLAAIFTRLSKAFGRTFDWISKKAIVN